MKNSTDIIILLDRSGSMSSIKKDMEGGFKTYLDELRKQPGEATVTLHQFDTVFETVYEAAALAIAPELNLEPRGGTALLDAMSQAIDVTGGRLKAMSEDRRPEHVLFVVITDGGENSSVRIKQADLKAKVEHQRIVYKWEFVYLGANQDAFAEAGSIGIALQNAGNYIPTSGGVKHMYAAAARSTNSLRSGGGAAVSLDADEA